MSGIAGVEGNGQRELVRVLAGLEAPDAGELRCGAAAVVHEDRHAEGLVLAASVRDNLVLGELGRFTRARASSTATALEREARARLDRARIVPPDLDAPAVALSGGNQQKIVVARAVARALAGRVSVLVFAQPTRGVDLGAARAIHGEIARAADAGKAVLVVSADLGRAARRLPTALLVMARGRIVAELPPDAPDDAARRGDAGREQRRRSRGVARVNERIAPGDRSRPSRASRPGGSRSRSLVWVYGESPREVAAQLVAGTWGMPYGVGQVLYKATPLLLSGVAVDLALRAGLFNIGAEGQLAVAGLAVGAVGARLPAGTPAWLALALGHCGGRGRGGGLGGGSGGAARALRRARGHLDHHDEPHRRGGRRPRPCARSRHPRHRAHAGRRARARACRGSTPWASRRCTAAP